MFIQIDMTSEIPIYVQLKQSIIMGIATGQLKQGEELPSVRQFAADLSINMHTISKAYAQLKDQGFISVHRNKGALINAPEQYAADEKYLGVMAGALSELAAEALCRGISEEQWHKICMDAYAQLTKPEEI